MQVVCEYLVYGSTAVVSGWWMHHKGHRALLEKPEARPVWQLLWNPFKSDRRDGT